MRMQDLQASVQFVCSCFVLSVVPGGAALAAAPSVPLFGSYFPSWLLSFGAAVLLTVLVRIVFVAVRLEYILQWRAIVYFSLVVGFTALIELSVF